MESESPGGPIFQVGSISSHSSSASLRPVVQEPVVCLEDFDGHPRVEYPNYKSGLARMLGLVQLVSGVLCIILNMGMALINYNDSWHISAGWWASPFMIFAGSFALSSSKIVNKITIHATLWLSLVSSFMTIAVIVQGTMSLLMGQVCNYECYNSSGEEIAHYLISSFFVLFGMFEFGASIIQFVIGCQAVCVPTRPQIPFDSSNNSGAESYTNSVYPPPPPPYDAESYVPEDLSFGSPIAESITTGSDPYLPSYEESLRKS